MINKKRKKAVIMLVCALLIFSCGCEKENYYENNNNNESYNDTSELKKVVFEKEEKSVGLGTQTQLEYILMPSGGIVKNCVFESSDESVITVDDTGMITALRIGTSTIKATFNDDIVCECTVTVEELPGAVFTYDIPSKVYTGDSFEATVTLEEYNCGMIKIVTEGVTGSITCEEEIASFSDDVNTVCLVGNVFSLNLTVTATSDNSSITVLCYDNGVLIESYTHKMDILSDKLEVFPAEITVVAGSTVSLDYSGTSGITWTSSNNTIASVSGGVVTAKKAGTAKITASNGKAKGSIKVNVIDEPTEETTAE